MEPKIKFVWTILCVAVLVLSPCQALHIHSSFSEHFSRQRYAAHTVSSSFASFMRLRPIISQLSARYPLHYPMTSTAAEMKLMVDILFEDDHIIVVDKPPNVLSVPGKCSRVQDFSTVPRYVTWDESVRIAIRDFLMQHDDDKETLLDVNRFGSSSGLQKESPSHGATGISGISGTSGVDDSSMELVVSLSPPEGKSKISHRSSSDGDSGRLKYRAMASARDSDHRERQRSVYNGIEKSTIPPDDSIPSFHPPNPNPSTTSSIFTDSTTKASASTSASASTTSAAACAVTRASTVEGSEESIPSQDVPLETSEDELNTECVKVFRKLLLTQTINFPRKKKSFIAFLHRHFGLTDTVVAERMFEFVSRIDFERSRKNVNSQAPDHVINMADVLEEMYGRRVFVVHRLDMETSGILIFAKTPESCSVLSEQFREKGVEKEYVARVSGRVSEELKRIDVPIRPDYDNRPYQVVDFEGGKPSVTLVQVLSYGAFIRDSRPDERSNYLNSPFPPPLPSITSSSASKSKAAMDETTGDSPRVYPYRPRSPTANIDSSFTITSSPSPSSSSSSSSSSSLLSSFHPLESSVSHLTITSSTSSATSSSSSSATEMMSTLVRLKPITGRTHQLRLHMAQAGHPMLGDTLYADPAALHACHRLCLHAETVRFTHPVTGLPMAIRAPTCNF